MAMVTLPVNVSSAPDASFICFDGNSPMVNLALSIKIPVHDMIKALADFQRQHEEIQQKELPPVLPLPKAAEPAKLQHAHAAPPALPAPVSPGLATPAVSPHPLQQPPSEPNVPGMSPSAVVPPPQAKPPGPAPELTWDSEIAELQANHEEYVKLTKWKVSRNHKPNLILEDPTSLKDFVPEQLPLPPRPVRTLAKRAPVEPPAASPAEQGAGPTPAADGSSWLASSAPTGNGGGAKDLAADPTASSATAPVGAGGAPRSQDELREAYDGAAPLGDSRSPPPPPISAPPPPPPPGAADGSSAPFASTPASGNVGRPPGLPVPPPPPLPSPPAGAGGGAAPPGAAAAMSKDGKKECKQQ